MKTSTAISFRGLGSLFIVGVIALVFAFDKAFAAQKEPFVDVITGASVVSLPKRPIRIASIVLPETPSTLQAVEETQKLLRRAFSPHPVEFEVLSSKQLTERIRLGTVDAFIASSGFYWRMTKYGVSNVGTLISKLQPDPNNATALAFLVRAQDNRFDELYDLRNRIAGSTFSTAFMTHRIGLAEVAKLGENPDKFFKQVIFTGNTSNDDVVAMLDRGEVDVAMVKACWLEDQPLEIQQRYRVLSPQLGGVLCQHSTSTYPGIMMAVTQGAPPNIAHIIARTILANSQLSAGYRWGVSTDLRAVDDVYRLLKIENYAYLRSMTLKGWLISHWQIPSAVAAVLLGLILHAWRTSVLVRRRTAELTAAMAKQQKAQSEIRALSEQMESLHKLTVVGQLSSMIAHELSQPLAAVQYYCESQRDLLQNSTINTRLLEISRQGIEKALARTRDIVDKVRSYNHGTPSRSDSVDVARTVARIQSTLNQDLLGKTNITVTCASDLAVQADPLEFELMLSNLMKNALEACNETPHPTMTIECYRRESRSIIRIENSGKVLTQEDLQRIQTPLLTTKATGLGLGVTIANALAEASGGQVDFCIRTEGGLIATLSLPSAQPHRLAQLEKANDIDHTEGCPNVH